MDNSEKVFVRLAEKADAERLIDFNQAMAFETEGKNLDSEILANGVKAVFQDENKGFYIVAESEGKIVGGLMITYEWSDWRNKWFWWIQSVYILPDFRGKHIYSMLYDYVKQTALEKGNVCGFRLYVEKDNLNAQKVYEKRGMESSFYLMYEEKI